MRVVSFPRSVRRTVPKLVCSRAQPSPCVEATAMHNVVRSLSQGTIMAVRLPCPTASCSIAPETARGEPEVTNSKSFSLMAICGTVDQ